MTDEVKPDWERHVASLTGLGGELTRDLWRRLRAVCPTLTQPTQAGTYDNCVEMIWDDGQHHLSVNKFPNGTVEWFYRDRMTEQLDSENDSAAPFDSAFHVHAAHFLYYGHVVQFGS